MGGGHGWSDTDQTFTGDYLQPPRVFVGFMTGLMLDRRVGMITPITGWELSKHTTNPPDSEMFTGRSTGAEGLVDIQS